MNTFSHYYIRQKIKFDKKMRLTSIIYHYASKNCRQKENNSLVLSFD